MKIKQFRLIFFSIHSQQEHKKQWTHPRTGKSKSVSGDLPFGWAKEVIN